MMARSFIATVTAGLIFAVSGCSDRRPEIAVAKADFSRLYPAAEIVSIRVSEDEVEARTFAITYLHLAHSQAKTIEIQYLENNQGVYEIAPPPPSELR